MSAPRRIRLLASFALLCALFLPLAECRKDKSAPAPPFSIAHLVFPQDSEYASYTYPFQALEKEDWGAPVTLLAFSWPLVFLAVHKGWPRSRAFWLTHLLELSFAGASGYWVLVLSALGGDPLYGFFVAMGANTCLLCTALWALVGDIRALCARLLRPALAAA